MKRGNENGKESRIEHRASRTCPVSTNSMRPLSEANVRAVSREDETGEAFTYQLRSLEEPVRLQRILYYRIR